MTTETVSAELRQVLRDLKLSGVLDTLPERVALARQNQPHQEFLTVVLADEVARRERRSAITRARAARLDASMALEGWDESTDAVYDRDLWAELCTLRFVEDRRDLVVMGPGRGRQDLHGQRAGPHRVPATPHHLDGPDRQLLKRLRASRLDGNTTPNCAGSSVSSC